MIGIYILWNIFYGNILWYQELNLCIYEVSPIMIKCNSSPPVCLNYTWWLLKVILLWLGTHLFTFWRRHSCLKDMYMYKYKSFRNDSVVYFCALNRPLECCIQGMCIFKMEPLDGSVVWLKGNSPRLQCSWSASSHCATWVLNNLIFIHRQHVIQRLFVLYPYQYVFSCFLAGLEIYMYSSHWNSVDKCTFQTNY